MSGMWIKSPWVGISILAVLSGCAKSSQSVVPAQAAASPNLSMVGTWISSDKAEEPRNREAELETLYHPQVLVNKDATFTLYQGRKYSGRWRQTGSSLRLDARKVENPDKNGAMQDESATMDLTLSQGGKTLT